MNLRLPDYRDRNPFRSSKLYHKERARETGMGAGDLTNWWTEVQALSNPIRRDLHLFTLLSGLRRQKGCDAVVNGSIFEIGRNLNPRQ